MEKILEQIRDFADKAHNDQKRKYTPDRYIVHPIRVMLICKEYTDNINVLAAALLHDVLEDTPVDKEELKKFLMQIMTPVDSITTLNYVIELTDVYTKEDYPQLNRKKRKAKETERLEKSSSEAQTIKYADIIDNSIEIANYDTDFAPVFLSECKNTLERIPKGNADLYERAIKVVEDSINKANNRLS
ncbi:HD domain-containing protein [Albibacterium bauzanense]|uniref:HD domain-containing protein n=1 Tax=Albibacterium bauzanense TaxID=653929 RepID=A0A4R1LP08_9SPHI|nr:HD domain-containing protein [Albibacterium bauzanense]TCK80798.1 HD domain-containing protein [Albibacterium bauzanense]